jgi:hypothetical protein
MHDPIDMCEHRVTEVDRQIFRGIFAITCSLLVKRIWRRVDRRPFSTTICSPGHVVYKASRGSATAEVTIGKYAGSTHRSATSRGSYCLMTNALRRCEGGKDEAIDVGGRVRADESSTAVERSDQDHRHRCDLTPFPQIVQHLHPSTTICVHDWRLGPPSDLMCTLPTNRCNKVVVYSVNFTPSYAGWLNVNIK